jgi:hypothetical protein
MSLQKFELMPPRAGCPEITRVTHAVRKLQDHFQFKVKPPTCFPSLFPLRTEP